MKIVVWGDGVDVVVIMRPSKERRMWVVLVRAVRRIDRARP